MNTAGNFLLPDYTLAIECLVFLIVLGVLSRVALPRLRRATEERQQQVDDAQRTIAQAATTRETALDDAHRITTAAHAKARDIINRGRAHHDALVAEGIRKGREEYEWRAGRARRETARGTAPAHPSPPANRLSVVAHPAGPRR